MSSATFGGQGYGQSSMAQRAVPQPPLGQPTPDTLRSRLEVVRQILESSIGLVDNIDGAVGLGDLSGGENKAVPLPAMNLHGLAYELAELASGLQQRLAKINQRL